MESITIIGKNLKIILNHKRLLVKEAARHTKLSEKKISRIIKSDTYSITRDDLDKLIKSLVIKDIHLTSGNFQIKDLEDYHMEIRNKRADMYI